MCPFCHCGLADALHQVKPETQYIPGDKNIGPDGRKKPVARKSTANKISRQESDGSEKKGKASDVPVTG